MKLSILICSLKSRSLQLGGLLLELSKQEALIGPGRVEVITSIDDGEMSIGAKRNRLLGLATGDYIAFIDDDDFVSGNYLELILDAIETEPDCVGINLTYTVDGKNPETAEHSIKYKEWVTRKVGTKNYYERTPNHLNPVKREIALMAGFPDKSHGEDHEYSNELRQLLHTEVMIEQPVYFYQCISEKKVISLSTPNNDSCEFVEKAGEFLPDWICRFYCPRGTDHELVRKLKEAGAQVFVKEEKEDYSDFWRWEVFLDSKVSKAMIAGTDFVPNEHIGYLLGLWDGSPHKVYQKEYDFTAVKGFIPDFKGLYFQHRGDSYESFIESIMALINENEVMVQ